MKNQAKGRTSASWENEVEEYGCLFFVYVSYDCNYSKHQLLFNT
jgi:hypothetical protein